MSIPDIGLLGAAAPLAGTSVAATSYLDVDPARSGAGSSFSAALSAAVENVQTLQDTTSELAVRAVTGDLDDVHDYSVAAAEAAVTLELTAAIRNKAVEAFTEIMRMQA